MGGPATRRKFPKGRTLRQQIKKLRREGKIDELMKLSFKGGKSGNPSAWYYLKKKGA